VKKTEKNTQAYTINTADVEGDGSFACPKCGTSISPDDETEDNYKIISTEIVNDELTELVLACNKCSCTIRLIGFQTDANT